MSKLDRQETRQPVRIPVASNRAPLVVKGFDHKNFSGRWVSDQDGRLADFLAGGYTFVTRDQIHSAGEDTVETSKGQDSRITKAGGRGITLYLMRIPRNLYDEDQAVKAKEVDQIEKTMKSPGPGTYGSVKIESDVT